jgi:hypothetical protein
MERISFDDFLKGSASGKYNALPQVQETAMNIYGERSAPPIMEQASSQLTDWFNQGETNATKPETKGVNRDAYKSNPSGFFKYGGADHKLIGSKYRVMNPDGTPMSSGASYDWWAKHHEEAKKKAQKPGMSTGRGSFFDRFERR